MYESILIYSQVLDGPTVDSETASTGSIPDLETVSDAMWEAVDAPPSTQPRPLEWVGVRDPSPRPDSPRPPLSENPRSYLTDTPRSPLFGTLDRSPLDRPPRALVSSTGHNDGAFEQYMLFIYQQQPVGIPFFCETLSLNS